VSKEIQLTHGKVAIVDDNMYEELSKYKWNAVRTQSGVWHAMCTLVMHRVVIKAPVGSVVDHIDRDGLNNIKENLRITTVAGNAANRAKKKSSQYIGVTKIANKGGTRWRAYIVVDGGYVCVGHYLDEETAARQRDQAALSEIGADVELNFPFDLEEEKISEE
jgi:hypothetical protein